ncbi:MAG: FAD:protein FMN transferase [Bacteroidales bacterium]|nr:FAD:protein FMN transferase [Bacteroidales bacterium]
MKYFTYIFLFLMISSCGNQPLKLHEYSGNTQGTYFHIKYYSKDTEDLNHEIDSILQDFDLMASIYNDSSIISKINRGEEPKLSEEFIELFNRSMQIAKESNGNFDITVGQLVEAWGFFKKANSEPDSAQVDSILQYIGYQKVSLENGKVIRDYNQTRFDFNAVAQGYSVDIICSFLEEQGVENYLVEIGGEVCCKGAKPNDTPWKVGIEKPADDPMAEQEIFRTLSVNDISIATSGSSRKFYEKDGIKYSHTINPHTGYPVSHTLLSVTVIAEQCLDADAWATAFMVMGVEKSKKILEKKPDMDAFFIYSAEDGTLQTDSTVGFGKYFEKTQ